MSIETNVYLLTSGLTGKKFHFLPGEKHLAKAALDQHEIETVIRRQAIAGDKRQLDAAEIKNGLNIVRVEDRSLSERIGDHNWRPTPVTTLAQLDTRDKYQQFDRTGGQKSFADLDAEMHAKYLARTAPQQMQTAQQAAAIDAATRAWDLVAFNEKATAKEFEFVQKLRKQAEHDLTTFGTMIGEFQAEQDAKALLHRQQTDLEIARLQKQRVQYTPISPEPIDKVEVQPVRPKQDDDLPSPHPLFKTAAEYSEYQRLREEQQ